MDFTPFTPIASYMLESAWTCIKLKLLQYTGHDKVAWTRVSSGGINDTNTNVGLTNALGNKNRQF